MSIQSYEGISSIQLLLHNLYLLGFDPKHDTTTSHVYEKIDFDTHLFTHHTNNTNHRAFECISYFLFQRMDVKETNNRFASCWPIHEHSASSRNYRMAAYQWLLELRDRGLLSRLTTLRRSYFDTCQGDAFTDILMSFSVLVLQTVLDRDLADPKGRPIRLTPSYSSNSSSKSDKNNSTPLQIKPTSSTILTEESAEIEKQLQDAIQALAQYTYQQKDDFATVVKKARGKAIVMKQELDDEKSRAISTLNHQLNNTAHTAPDLTRIRDRIAALRHQQRKKLQKLQQKHHQEQHSDISSQKKTAPLVENNLENTNEFEQIQAALWNDDSSHGVDQTIQDYRRAFTLPSLLPPVDSDPSEAIKRIQDLVQLRIQRN